MHLTRGLVATVATGLLGDALAAACCGRDACGKAVLAASGASDLCSSRLITTVTVTPTTTVALTSTAQSTITSDITLTQVQSETDLETLTSLVTSGFVSTVTAVQTLALTSTVVATVTDTAASTVTVTITPAAPSSSQPPIKRGDSAYAYGVCDDAAYVSACRCIGVRPTTITQTALAITATCFDTITQSPVLQTNTRVLTQTSFVTVFTTITATTTVTQLATLTNTVSTVANTATSLQTVVVTPTATVTAVTPPQCTGSGFELFFTPSVGGNVGLVFANSAGQAIFLMAFPESSRFTIDANSQLTSYYTSDYQPVVIYSSAHPGYLQAAFKYARQGVTYPGKQTSPFNCVIGPAPAYSLQCTAAGENGGQPLVGAICNSNFYLHLPGAATPTDLSCTDISVAASCPTS